MAVVNQCLQQSTFYGIADKKSGCKESSVRFLSRVRWRWMKSGWSPVSVVGCILNWPVYY